MWAYKSEYDIPDRPGDAVKAANLHNVHTSAVTALYFHPQKSILYSGGADHRLVGWSLHHEENVLGNIKMEDPVSDVLPIAGHPNLLLVGYID
jgi:hypothetical protein